MNARLAFLFMGLSLVCALPAFVDLDDVLAVPIPNYQTGYQPDQPINYSHRLHAGTLDIDCQYCHSGTDESRHAIVPNISTCMNCHERIEGKSERAKAEILKVRKYARPGADPIRWQRVHNLPDFVYFNHSAHIRNARNGQGIDCEECHGDMKQVGVAKQHSDLSMGWCIQCHRAENVKAEEEDWPRKAPLDCDACHR